MSNETRELQHPLRNYRILLSQFVEHTPAPIAVFDRDMKYIMTSRRFLTDYKLQLQDVVGRSHYEVFPEIPDRWKAIHQRCLAGATERAEEDPFPRADGTLDWVRWEIQPWHEESGAIGGIILFSEVITERKRAEEALQKSEQILFTVLETAAFAVALTSLPDGVIVYVNHSFENLFGSTKQEVVGKTSLELGIHRDPEARARGLIALQQHPSVRNLELGLYTKSDEPRICSVNLDIVEIRGHPYLLSTSQDITEHKRAEEALRDSERRYHEFVTGLPVAAYATDVAGRITLYNDAAVALWGRRPEPSDRWWGGSSKLYTPDGALLTYRHCPMAIATRERHAIQGFEAFFERPDGTRVYILANITPVTDDSDRVVGATNVMLDITERKQTEHALAEAERLRGSILESMQEGIHGLDITGHIVFENPAALQMFGWKEREMIGRHAHTLMHHHRPDGSVYPVEECLIYRTLRDGRIRHVDNELFFRPDGSSFPVEYTCAALTDDCGAIAGVVVTFRDTTDVRRLQEQLLQSQKIEALGLLAGGIAHDFNNNLSAILGFSNLALDRLRPEDPLHRYIQNVKKAGEQSASLTRQLLAFSRKQVLQPKVLDLNALIADLKMMLQRMIGELIALHLRLHPGLWRVTADPGQIEQVLMNLVVNARDAMPHGGTLTLETGNVEIDEVHARLHPPMLAGPYVRLAVEDTGCGMDAKTQARIFEPFFTTKELGKGTGLGLSTVYGIVKQSGGYIWVDSEPEKGTNFLIYLPRVEAPLEATPSPEVVTPALRGSETILLVDDDEMVRVIARDALQAQGYTVLEAMNAGGARLINERHQGAIDLLLTDVVMPYMSGPELAKQLAVQRPEMKILYMSGYMNETLAPHGVLQPGIAFLAKPLTTDLLVHKVREVLDAPV